MNVPLAQRIATWVADIETDQVPGEVRTVAKSCLVDVVGVSLAARNRSLARQAADYAERNYGNGAATVLNGGRRGDPAGAAFANGVAAHLLDFDDTCYAGIVHGSAVVFPAALAAAEATGASGSDLLAAFIAGVETTYTLGSVVGPEHYDKGWFATGSLGAIGAAAGAAKLICGDGAGGLDGIARAIALAAVQAGGLRVILGSDAKPYCAGRAAQAGIDAAHFARNDTTFPPDVFTGPNGFFALFGGGDQDSHLVVAPGDPYRLLEPGIFFKRYPLCSSAQAALEAVEDLMEQHGIGAEEMLRVTCALAPFAARCLPYLRPRTVTEAQFSLPFAVACRLVHGRMTAGLLSDATLADPRLGTAMDKVVLDGALENVDYHAYPEAARITIELADGRCLTATRLSATGDPRTPMTETELEAKFMSAAAGPDTGVTPQVAESCLARIRDLEALPTAAELFAPLREA